MEIEINKIYQHYKGDYYIVIDIAYLESNKEEMVVYQKIPNSIISQSWIRPVKEFQEKFKPV